AVVSTSRTPTSSTTTPSVVAAAPTSTARAISRAASPSTTPPSTPTTAAATAAASNSTSPARTAASPPTSPTAPCAAPTLTMSGGDQGGGILFSDNGASDLTISYSAITRNLVDFDGGGLWIYSSGGHVYIIDSTIAYNDALDDGGGIYADYLQNQRLRIYNST